MINAGKLGMTKATEKRRNRDPGDIWTTLLAMTMDRKDIILGTLIYQLKPSSKRMHRHLGRLNKRNIPTSPLLEETRNHW